MRDKIVIKGNQNENYRCDMNEPYSYNDINICSLIIIMLFMTSLILGVMSLILFSKPPISESPDKLVPIICFGFIAITEISVFLYMIIRDVNKKKKFDYMLEKAEIKVGSVVSITVKNKRIGIWEIIVKLDYNNVVIKLDVNSRFYVLNKKIAVAKISDKQFVLNKCTLINI